MRHNLFRIWPAKRKLTTGAVFGVMLVTTMVVVGLAGKNISSADGTQADLRIVTSAIVNGPDGIFGTADDSTTQASLGETIRYKLKYDNIGAAAADNAVISEVVPVGTCFMTESIDNLPAGATVEYSSDDSNTWIYQPSGVLDCNVTNFRINLGTLPTSVKTVSGASTNQADYLIGQADILAGKTIKQVAAGLNHICALDTAGQAYCWGQNNLGQLGNGNNNNYDVPVPVVIPSGVTFDSISVGRNSTCALATDGKAYCWGNNANHENGSISHMGASYNTPFVVTMPPGASFKSIAMGGTFGCALASDGQAYCWGYATGVVNSPAPMATGFSFSSMAAGYGNVCGLTAAGQAYCMGSDGSGAGPNSFTQVAMPPSVSFKSIAASASANPSSNSFTCAIATDGQAYCWGSNGSTGQLGHGAGPNSGLNAPMLVTVGDNFQAIAVGANFVCASSTANQIMCWGGDAYGSSGRVITLPSGVEPASVTAGGNQACVSSAGGQVYCWNPNKQGQLGNGLNSGAWVADAAPTSATKTVVLTVPLDAELSVYNTLSINQQIGQTTFPNEQYPGVNGRVDYYFKQLVGSTCGLSNPDIPGFSGPIASAAADQNITTQVDISTLDATTRSWCLVADYHEAGDVVSTFQMSYAAASDDLFVTFDTVVKSDISVAKISNTAQISTTTPEVTLANNQASYDLSVPSVESSKPPVGPPTTPSEPPTEPPLVPEPPDTGIGSVKGSWPLVGNQTIGTIKFQIK